MAEEDKAVTLFQFLMSNYHALAFLVFLLVGAYAVGESMGRRTILKRWKEADELMARAEKIAARKEKASVP